MNKKHFKKIAWSMALGVTLTGVTFAETFPSGSIFINGAKVKFNYSNGRPMNVNGRLHVPIRIMADYLGYETGWDAVTKTATVKGEGSEIKLKIDSPRATINGVSAYIDVREDGKPVLSTTATVREGRTYVPLRFVTETLGCEVKFEFGVTYINNGKDPVIKEDKYFKQMPPIPGKAAFNKEIDYAVIANYFGEYDGGREIPTYELDNRDVFFVYEDDQAVDISFYVWFTPGYNEPLYFTPEYAQARGVIMELFKYFLPNGGENLYYLVNDGFEGNLSDPKSFGFVDLQNKIGSDGRKVILTPNESNFFTVRIFK